MRLENKVALITGGYGGMGRASARLFANEGATVFIAGRNEERGAELAKEINDAGGTAHFTELDITNQDQWTAAVGQVSEKAGALHVLMNIVGSNALVMFPRSTSTSGTRSLKPMSPGRCGASRRVPR
jgi:NAD(P)-dependent dehydrogenase (short-subunit alcohol dehydrogenase family)